MNKIKNSRIGITIECLECRDLLNQKIRGVSRYLTSKNKKNNSFVLQLSKYCKYCKKHTQHKEIK
jgi:large subunit ribosomal protein L33